MISRVCIDPMTGKETDKAPTNFSGGGIHLYFPVIFTDHKKPHLLLEHIIDPDIKSLMINILGEIGILERSKENVSKLCTAIGDVVERILNEMVPENIEFEISEGGLSGACVTATLPDYSDTPSLDTEVIAKKILEDLLMVIVKCPKCGFLVSVDRDHICPECGCEIEHLEESVVK